MEKHDLLKTNREKSPFKDHEELALNANDEEILKEAVRKEKEKLLSELDSLQDELDKKGKEFIIMEIKNEVLKRMLFEEAEKYKTYAEYDF